MNKCQKDAKLQAIETFLLAEEPFLVLLFSTIIGFYCAFYDSDALHTSNTEGYAHDNLRRNLEKLNAGKVRSQ